MTATSADGAEHGLLDPFCSTKDAVAGFQWGGTGNDFDGSWSCWLGNYPNATSSLRGSLTAMRGALHLASSANYPNVARIVAKDRGAVYVHKGAQANPDVALCVEGGGRIYLAQDITVASLYTNGVRVAKEAGTYTTGDFDFLFANDDATQGPAEGAAFIGTLTDGKAIGLTLRGEARHAVCRSRDAERQETRPHRPRQSAAPEVRPPLRHRRDHSVRMINTERPAAGRSEETESFASRIPVGFVAPSGRLGLAAKV